MKPVSEQIDPVSNEPQRPKGIRIQLSPLVLLALLLVLIVPWLFLAWLNLASRSNQAVEKPPAPASSGAVTGATAGPWGDLDTVRIAIERPDEFISLNYTPKRRTRWFFQDYTALQLSDFLKGCELTEGQKTSLLDTQAWEIAGNGIWVTPSPDLILVLSPKARQRIYSLLAEYPENYFHHSSFKFRSDRSDEWFYQSGLSQETLNLVKSLLYPRGTALCFTDIVEVLGILPSESEKKRLVKTLSRQSTVLVKLKITRDSNVDALVDYWSKGGRAKDIRPLLDSLSKIPGGASIDIAHLMPPFARKRLYTYPYPSDDPMASKRDCFWTALNFFNEPPDDRYGDYELVKEVLQSDYYPVQNDAVFGDIVVLLNAQGRAIHSAVYLAADVLFTKNGAHFNQPWILMDFEDLMALYPSEKPIRVVAYRLKRNS